MEIMKKFMKFCFVLALLLIIAGSVFYLLGRGNGGREDMEEMLAGVGLDGLLEEKLGFDTVYELDDVTMFDSDHTVWKGSLDRELIGRGDVEDLVLEIGGSMVTIEESDDDNIYIDGKNVGKLQAYVEGSTLYVKSVRPASLMDEIKNSEIILYLPEESSLHLVDLYLGAGQLAMDDLDVDQMNVSIGAGQLLLDEMNIGRLEVSLGAGELCAEDMEVQSLSATIGAGNMEFSGDISKAAEINCSMGNVSMELAGKKQDFNYQLNCVAGNMEIDGDSYAGAVMERTIDHGADKTMQIDCSMGNVEIDF